MFLSNSITFFFIFTYLNDYIRGIFPECKENKKNIVLSTTHALFMALLSSFYLLNIIQQTIYIELIAISFGFTLYDTVRIVKEKNRIWKQMLFHHSIIIVSLFPLVYYGFTHILPLNLYPYYAAMNYLVEYATVPLNISWYFHETNRSNTIIFKVASASTLALYLPFRILNTFYLTLIISIYEEHIFPLQEIQIIFFLLNSYWFYKLCRKAYIMNQSSSNSTQESLYESKSKSIKNN